MTFTVDPLRVPVISSNDFCCGCISSKSIAKNCWFTPKAVAVDGSVKATPTSRSAFGNEKPRSMMPFTTLNCVVTAQMPSASTKMASAQNAFSLTSTRAPIRTSWAMDSASIRSPNPAGAPTGAPQTNPTE